MTAIFRPNVAAAVPPTLTDELVELLGLLDGPPEGVAEGAISLLPYGSRASLVTHGVIERMKGGEGDAVRISVTPEGRVLIHECGRLGRSSKPPKPQPRRVALALSHYLRSLEQLWPTTNLAGIAARIHRHD